MPDILEKIKQIFILKINFIPLQKGEVFLPECRFPMMFRLVQNVFHHVVQLTAGMGKCPETFLPVETERRKVFFFNKIGGFSFQNLYGVGKGNSRIGPYQDVCMVGHEVNGQEFMFFVLQNARHVPLRFFPEFGFDERLTVFHGKDQMGVELRVRIRHSPLSFDE